MSGVGVSLRVCGFLRGVYVVGMSGFKVCVFFFNYYFFFLSFFCK